MKNFFDDRGLKIIVVVFVENSISLFVFAWESPKMTWNYRLYLFLRENYKWVPTRQEEEISNENAVQKWTNKMSTSTYVGNFFF